MDFLRQSGTLEIEEDAFIKNAQGVAMIKHEALLLMKIFQMKPQFKKEKFFGFYYAIFLNSSKGGETGFSDKSYQGFYTK